MKYCEDCKHFRQYYAMNILSLKWGANSKYARCTKHPEPMREVAGADKYVSRVIAEPPVEYRFCSIARYMSTECGPDAQSFELKEAV
jgi:hypothetical protein